MSNLISPIKDRKSPLAFDKKPVSPEVMNTLFEAARWSASAFNEQPWRFVYAHKANTAEFDRILQCLGESNQVWAKQAGVLMIAAASFAFLRNDRQNKHSRYDLGQAVAQLSIQATSMGLALHQMAGFSAEKAEESLLIPGDFEAVTAIALGYPGKVGDLPEELIRRANAPRTRNEIELFAFENRWKV